MISDVIPTHMSVISTCLRWDESGFKREEALPVPVSFLVLIVLRGVFGFCE